MDPWPLRDLASQDQCLDLAAGSVVIESVGWFLAEDFGLSEGSLDFGQDSVVIKLSLKIRHKCCYYLL